jgi:hypothetical protein
MINSSRQIAITYCESYVDQNYVPVKASSGSTRRSKFQSRDSFSYNKASAWAMLAVTSPSTGVNCSVAILIVVEDAARGWF